METRQTISEWAEATFGSVTLLDAAKRCRQELDELIALLEANPNDPKVFEEIADVQITFARVVHLSKIDLQSEVNQKMTINRARKWVLNGDGTGQHA